jgi:hypothetical protein
LPKVFTAWNEINPSPRTLGAPTLGAPASRRRTDQTRRRDASAPIPTPFPRSHPQH